MLTVTDLDEAIEFAEMLIAARKASRAQLQMARWRSAYGSSSKGAVRQWLNEIKDQTKALTTLRSARRMLISYRAGLASLVPSSSLGTPKPEEGQSGLSTGGPLDASEPPAPRLCNC